MYDNYDLQVNGNIILASIVCMGALACMGALVCMGALTV